MFPGCWQQDKDNRLYNYFILCVSVFKERCQKDLGVEKVRERLQPDMNSSSTVGASDDEDHQEKTLSQVYDRLPEGRTPLDLLKKKEERDRVGETESRAAGNVDEAQTTWPETQPSRSRSSPQAKPTSAGPSRATKRLWGYTACATTWTNWRPCRTSWKPVTSAHSTSTARMKRRMSSPTTWRLQTSSVSCWLPANTKHVVQSRLEIELGDFWLIQHTLARVPWTFCPLEEGLEVPEVGQTDWGSPFVHVGHQATKWLSSIFTGAGLMHDGILAY